MASAHAEDAPAEIDAVQSLVLFSEQAWLCRHVALFVPGVRLLPAWRALGADAWCGWGLKPASRVAALAARVTGKTFLRLEDGFVRSVGLGKSGAALMSVVIDDSGIFYDARRPSRLERLVAASTTSEWRARGQAVRRLLIDRRLSKYNAQPDLPVRLGARSRPRVLLVDQVYGDLSIAGSLSTAETFTRMIETARRERPDAELLVRTHPDVTAGYRRGYLADPGPGCSLLTDAVDTHAILDAVDEVWTVSSQIGFEALLRDVPVTTFGVPFYAGYGLTRDRADSPAARAVLAKRSEAGADVDALAAAALVRYARYADPAAGRAIEAEEAFEIIARLRAAGDAMHGRSSDRNLRRYSQTGTSGRYLRPAGGQADRASVARGPR